MLKTTAVGVLAGLMGSWLAAAAPGQDVCLPSPRLLTIMPMGGRIGADFEVEVSGENLDQVDGLLFSHPRITARPKVAADGTVEANRFLVAIADDVPEGVYDARVTSRLGISTSRAFCVGSLPEVTRSKPNTTPETAIELNTGSTCNATMTARSVDYYRFKAAAGMRVGIECAARGIDSKLSPVLIVADAKGRDLLVDRRGGFLDFQAPADGTYLIKLHGLTFQGGAEQFYRLTLREEPGTAPATRQASTSSVSTFSWDPDEAAQSPAIPEAEPNNQHAQAQKISPPCEIAGRFFPAADVDTFEFAGKKGEVWWVEVASERLGLATNPFVVVQRAVEEGSRERLDDVAEFNDIPSPIKPSSNGYSYDGPPYDAGSSDALGKLEIKEDGMYRVQVRDLFGGTRSEPRNRYRLMIRAAAPDFAVVAWAHHMNLRNGDRSALSKPIALRAGSTMALEVAVVRKDGFDGEIELGMSDLPAGISAAGLKVPAGSSTGMILISADANSTGSIGLAKIYGTAQIGGKAVTRRGHLASVAWPVKDASQEIPNSRLLADVPVSVSGAESSPVTIAPTESKVWEAKAGEKLVIPLKVTWRSEFTGASVKMSPWGAGFAGVKEVDIPLKATAAEVVLDLASLKLPPGESTLAFCGSAVIQYRANPGAVKQAEEGQKAAEQDAAAAAAVAKSLADQAAAAPAEKKPEAEMAAKAAVGKVTLAEAAKAEAAKRMKAAADAAAPRDIVDLVVSEPIRILVRPKDEK